MTKEEERREWVRNMIKEIIEEDEVRRRREEEEYQKLSWFQKWKLRGFSILSLFGLQVG